MRKNIYITFGGKAYDPTCRFIVDNAPRYGADEVRVYDDRWILDSEFYQINRAWWSRPDTKYDLPNRGFGWFIWKPYVILHALSRCTDGDVVLYTDADEYPTGCLLPLFETARREGAMFFAEQGCNHRNFCKADTLITMATGYRNPDQSAAFDAQTPAWIEQQFIAHATARVMLFRRDCWRSYQLLIEWLTYCLNPLANTFDASRIDTDPDSLHEPRCEQAILTSLIHSYGYPLYRTPDQAGDGEKELHRDLFGTIFWHDGRGNDKTNVSGSAYRNVP